MTNTIRVWWGVVGICLVTFIVIAILSDQIFEHVPHSEDEVAYIFQAKVFAHNRLAVPTPPFEDAFWSPFVVDYQGQRFGKYHPGWPLLLSLGVRLNMPWIVNALLATATLAMIAWLGYYYYCSHQPDVCYMPILVAGLGLVTPGFLFLSSSLLSHPASLFWATLALVAIFQLTTTEKPLIFAILIGFSMGAAFITRPFAAFGAGSAMSIFLLVLALRREIKWIWLCWVLVAGLSVAALLPLYWWAITGDPAFNGYILVWPYDRIGFGPDIGPYGYTLHTALFINTRLKLAALATGLFGWPGWTSLVFLPILFLVKKSNRWDWLLLGTILGMIIVHIFYWAFGGIDGRFPRYYYDALPALLLLTARGMQISIHFLAQTGKGLSFGDKKIPLPWLLVGLIACFIGYNIVWNLPSLLMAQKGKYNITATPLRVVEQANLTEPALIFIKDVESWSDFAAPFAANSPLLEGQIVYAIDWGPEFIKQVRQQFPNRRCWKLAGETLQQCPIP